MLNPSAYADGPTGERRAALPLSLFSLMELCKVETWPFQIHDVLAAESNACERGPNSMTSSAKLRVDFRAQPSTRSTKEPHAIVGVRAVGSKKPGTHL